MLNPDLKTDNVGKSSNLRTRAFGFSKELLNLCKALPEKKVYWIVQDQLLRSGTSVGANLVEAKSSSSKRDFIKFYEIALKSANETEYWLLLLCEVDESYDMKVKKLLVELEEIARMTAKSLLTLKNRT